MQAERIQRLQQQLSSQNLDQLFITNPTNIYYLSGIHGVSEVEREFTGLLDAEKLTLFVPGLYQGEASKINDPKIKVEIIPERHYLFTKAAEQMKGTVAFEADNLRFSEYEAIQKSGAKLTPTYGLIEKVRVSKDEAELELVRKAVDITDKAFDQIASEIKKGMTEVEVQKRMKQLLTDEFGGEGLSFEPIVASGAGSAFPHYTSTDKKIEDGVLLIDAGAKFGRYCADLTRTYYVGEPTQEFIDRYNLVQKAQTAGMEATKPGVTEESTYQAAIEALGDQAEYMIHGLGHGIGLDEHEDPFLRKDKKGVLQAGMLITIEPGVYYQGWGGIRIEDYVLVTETGIEVLSKAKKGIISVG